MRRLLRESEGNGGLRDKALFDLLVAGHEEAIDVAATLATETKSMAEELAQSLAQERRDLKTAVDKVREDLMAYNVHLGGKLDTHIKDDSAQLARIASHLESESGTINRAIIAHCKDTSAHGRQPRREGDPPDSDYSVIFSGRYDREKYDQSVRKHFMSITTRYVVIAIVVAMLLSLGYLLLANHGDLQTSVATGLSSTIAVAMLIWAMLRKEKP
jgi:hypothetical protein